MDDSILGPKMQIAIERDSRVPVYRQIEAQIRTLILEGRLPKGARLPSERILARHLGVNRTTVVNAYRELSADGLVKGRVGHGTIVLGPVPRQEEAEPPAGMPLVWTGLIRSRVRGLQSLVVRRVADLASRPGIISLATGVPEVTSSPYLHLEQTVQKVITSGQRALLQDSPIAGLMPLRAELARRLAMKGCSKPSASQVLILSGSQQGLYLVAQLLLEPGDAVLVESPTYLGALEVFRAIGARLIGVPVDSQGMHVKAAEQIMSRVNIRLIYTIPNFQNPTGSTMSAERRTALLALAQRFQVPILEDDLYGELFYDVSLPAPIRAADEGGYVLYLGSLSPVLGPGFRLGWLVAPLAVIEPLTALRQAMDLHPGNFVQEVVYELLVSGSFDIHLEWVRRAYAARRDTMLAALEQYMPGTIRWQPPQGGFYVWCSLERPLSSRDLLEEAAEEGVVFVPGEAFFPDGRGEQFLRLSFAHASLEEITEGIRRLAKVARRLEKRERQDTSVETDRPIV